jgi:hypothetical protein
MTHDCLSSRAQNVRKNAGRRPVGYPSVPPMASRAHGKAA